MKKTMNLILSVCLLGVCSLAFASDRVGAAYAPIMESLVVKFSGKSCEALFKYLKKHGATSWDGRALDEGVALNDSIVCWKYEEDKKTAYSCSFLIDQKGKSEPFIIDGDL